jgi:hypothetical protein
LAEVVDIGDLSDDRKDDVVGNLVRGERGGRPNGEADRCGEEKNPSGCRPVASHNEDGRSGSRPKARTLATESARVTR